MYRTKSTSRVSDEYYMSVGQIAGQRSAAGLDHLPMYDPQIELAKKEAARLWSAENMVHLIPIVIIICASVLWMFSNPNIEMMSRDDSILDRIKNMTIDGYNNWNDTTVTVGIEDLDPIDEIVTKNSVRNIHNENQYK